MDTAATWLPEDFIQKDLMQFRPVSDQRTLLERFNDHVAQKRQDRLLDTFIYSSIDVNIHDLFVRKN